MSAKRPRNRIALATVGIWIMAVVGAIVLNHLGTTWVLDLSIGLVAFTLAMYIYHKEVLLEGKVARTGREKEQKAYADILTSLHIFGQALDRILIIHNKRGEKTLNVPEESDISMLHRSLSMVFSSHIDVINKDLTARLVQHISFLEQYAPGRKVDMKRHMDNMHYMDHLKETISGLVEGKGVPEAAGGKLWMSLRHNRFIIYLLDEISGIALDSRGRSGHDVSVDIVTKQNPLYYYISADPEMKRKVNEGFAETDGMLAAGDASEDAYVRYAGRIRELADEVEVHNKRLRDERGAAADLLADYAVILRQIHFLIEAVGELPGTAPWRDTVRLRMGMLLKDMEGLGFLADERREGITDEVQGLIEFGGGLAEFRERLTGLMDGIEEEVRAHTSRIHG